MKDSEEKRARGQVRASRPRREDKFPSLRKLGTRIGIKPADLSVALARAAAINENPEPVCDLTEAEFLELNRLLDMLKASRNGE
jgi:hypothetical protein